MAQYVFTMHRLGKVVPPKREILKNISLSFFPGAKIGVLGLNGSGKSTLLKIMAGVDTEFEGEARPMPELNIGYLPQEPQLDPAKTVREVVEEAVSVIKDAQARLDEVYAAYAEPDADFDKLAAEQAKLEAILQAGDGHNLERQLEVAADALRLPAWDAKVEHLSGGEKRRVALCRLLLSAPDMLLLDEPTNHLDAESVEWLEQFLARYTGTVVAVTHDRYFLDNAAEWILELDNGKGLPFEGSYAEWLAAKAVRRAESKRAADAASKAADKELEWLRSAKAGSKTKARLKSYDALVDAARTADDASVGAGAIWIPPGPRLGEEVIVAENLRKEIGDRVLIDDLSFEVPRASVVGIVGANGAGKSTLIKMLTGQEPVTAGEVKVGGTVKLASVDQAREALDAKGSQSVFEAICGERETLDLGEREVNARAYVSAFGFRSREQSKKIKDLSGGERNRAQLASVVREGGNVLVLDEPTNDLDVGTLRALEEAILGFAGTVLVVSHDRFFLDRVATHILAFEGDSHVEVFNGNWAEYAANRLERGLGDEVSNFKYRKLVEARVSC